MNDMLHTKKAVLTVHDALKCLWCHITDEPFTLNYPVPRFHLVCQMNRMVKDIVDLALLRVFDNERFCEKFAGFTWEEGLGIAECNHPLGTVTMTFQPNLDFDVEFEFSGDSEAAVDAVYREYYGATPDFGLGPELF